MKSIELVLVEMLGAVPLPLPVPLPVALPVALVMSDGGKRGAKPFTATAHANTVIRKCWGAIVDSK